MRYLINVGDTVQLESGGPEMHVLSVGVLNGVPAVWCEWLEDGLRRKTGTFNLDLLQRMDTESGRKSP
jgi:uncharacterized protein YodC (DUF2158 family)